MKSKNLFVFLSLLGFVVALVTACSSSSNPAAPAATATPTFTFTPTCGNATGTCTPTFTFTYTNTATDTNTSTPTNTFTVTDTYTATSTPTNTATSTNTGTPTNTATITDTFTITSTPTVTSTFTVTSTPTNTIPNTATGTPTNTVINTPTSTPTSTNTVCPTQPAPTATSVTTNGIAMQVTYNGSGTVSSSNPIYVYITDTFSGSPSFQAIRFLDANGASVTVYGMNNGTYYLAMFYNAAGDGHFKQSGGVNPHVNDQAQFYGISSGCNPAGATAIVVNGGINNLGSVSFTGGSIWGFAGTLTYSGVGTVNNCNPICVAYYTDSGYSSQKSSKSYTANGSRYDLDTFDIGGGCSSASAYVQAWYAKSGDTSSPQAGDPVTQLGSVANAATTALNITIP